MSLSWLARTSRPALLLALAVLMSMGTTAYAATPTPGTTGGASSRPAQTYPTIVPVTVPKGGSSASSFSGRAVNFDLSGLEPDFDPLYAVTVSGTLHDRRPAPLALPDATLILSSYLEVFKPDTTPILPDLLHPDQMASDLAGFLSGKAALVNIGGHRVYHGSLLAEIFQDSTEHLVVDLDPVHGVGSVRLEGVITLNKGGAESGTLRVLQPLAPAALAVPPGVPPSWQSVVSSLNVSPPAMRGTSGSSTTHAPAKSIPGLVAGPPQHTGRAPLLPVPVAVGLGAILILVILAGPSLWRRFRSAPHPLASP